MKPAAVVAHCGASGDCPENAATASGAAVRMGVESVEPDAHLTADRPLAVIHGPTVDRAEEEERARLVRCGG